MPAREFWQNYSVESTGGVAIGTTDGGGYIDFPERTLWAPVGLRLAGPVMSVLRSGFHASFGSSAHIVPLCDVLERGERMSIFVGGDAPTKVVLGYFDRGGIRAATGMPAAPSECQSVEKQARQVNALVKSAVSRAKK
jgi:hypothetical protein